MSSIGSSSPPPPTDIAIKETPQAGVLQTSRSVAGGRFGDEADLHEPGALHGVDHTADAPVTRIRVAADMHLGQFRNATGHRFLEIGRASCRERGCQYV